MVSGILYCSANDGTAMPSYIIVLCAAHDVGIPRAAHSAPRCYLCSLPSSHPPPTTTTTTSTSCTILVRQATTSLKIDATDRVPHESAVVIGRAISWPRLAIVFTTCCNGRFIPLLYLFGICPKHQLVPISIEGDAIIGQLTLSPKGNMLLPPLLDKFYAQAAALALLV